MTMNAFFLYLRYVSASLKSQMQYKVSFLLQVVGQFLAGILFLIIGLKLWKVGERHYRSTGS